MRGTGQQLLKIWPESLKNYIRGTDQWDSLKLILLILRNERYKPKDNLNVIITKK